MRKIISLLLGYRSKFYLSGTGNGWTLDYGSESPILMFETKKIHIGNQTINSGLKISDSKKNNN
jgi:hypothetical protein